MAPLLDTAARVLAHPSGQQALATVLRLTGEWWLNRQAPKDQSITDRLIALVEQQAQQIQQLLEASGQEVTRSHVEIATSTVPPPPASMSSKPTAISGDVSTGCIPCTLAHLAATAGSLEEAVRFARGDPQGPGHPEAMRRVETALLEITNLEREDLRPDKLEAMPEPERRLVETYLPKIRSLRQQLSSPIPDAATLQSIAANSERLFREFHREVRHTPVPGKEQAG